MKLPKILILAITLILLQINFAQGQTHEVKAIDVGQFEALMKNKGAVRIIDVRTPEEIAEGKIPGSIAIDYQNENFTNEISKLDKRRTYILYCKAGIRSSNAASIMKEAGFTHLYSLDGGIEAWKKAGKTIEK